MKTGFIFVGLVVSLMGVVLGVMSVFDKTLIPGEFAAMVGLFGLTFVGIGCILVEQEIILKKLEELKKK